MDEHEKARHDETMAAYAAAISRANAAQAQAGADQARTALADKRVDIERAATQRFEDAFAAVSMESAMRRADLHEAFNGWATWSTRHHHGREL